MKKMHHPKDTSLLGIGIDLAREEIKGTPKVVTVSFLYFIP